MAEVLGALFDSMRENAEQEPPAKRQRGSGSSSNKGSRHPMRLETPFRDYQADIVSRVLRLMYDASSFKQIADTLLSDHVELEQVIRLCDQLDARTCLRRLDAALETVVRSEGLEGDVELSVDILLSAERYRHCCSRLFNTVAAQLGGMLCNPDDTNVYLASPVGYPLQRLLGCDRTRQLSSETLLLLMGCMGASTCGACDAAFHGFPVVIRKPPEPAFHFPERLHYKQTVEVFCPLAVEGADVGHGGRPLVTRPFYVFDQRWQVHIIQEAGSWLLGLHTEWLELAAAAKAVWREFNIKATVVSSSGHDLTTNHSIGIRRPEYEDGEAATSNDILVTVQDLQDPAKGLLLSNGRARLRFEMECQCLDM